VGDCQHMFFLSFLNTMLHCYIPPLLSVSWESLALSIMLSMDAFITCLPAVWSTDIGPEHKFPGIGDGNRNLLAMKPSQAGEIQDHSHAMKSTVADDNSGQ
jgi:hypothetical protein